MKDWKSYLNRKLFQPFKRSYSNPNYLARSAAVGMSFAFAPFPGQTPVVGALWLISRKLKWRFSLAISLALTFISNIFTNFPLFYLYYKTGDWLRQKPDNLSYKELRNIFGEGLFDGFKFMLSELGLSIVIGSLLFMIVFGLLGYGLGYLTALYTAKK